MFASLKPLAIIKMSQMWDYIFRKFVRRSNAKLVQLARVWFTSDLVYILCSGVGSIPIGCWYMNTSWPLSENAVLLLFRPFCTCSCTRCANQKHSSRAAPCSTFTLGTVLQHDPHATERITTLRFTQRRKVALKIFLEDCRSSQLFWSAEHNSG